MMNINTYRRSKSHTELCIKNLARELKISKKALTEQYQREVKRDLLETENVRLQRNKLRTYFDMTTHLSKALVKIGLRRAEICSNYQPDASDERYAPFWMLHVRRFNKLLTENDWNPSGPEIRNITSDIMMGNYEDNAELLHMVDKLVELYVAEISRLRYYKNTPEHVKEWHRVEYIYHSTGYISEDNISKYARLLLS